MALSEKTTELDNHCHPGDITVSRIHNGYLIGRALSQDLGPGPWWEYIALVRTLDDAIHHAKTLAAQADVQAWMHVSWNGYEPLPA